MISTYLVAGLVVLCVVIGIFIAWLNRCRLSWRGKYYLASNALQSAEALARETRLLASDRLDYKLAADKKLRDLESTRAEESRAHITTAENCEMFKRRVEGLEVAHRAELERIGGEVMELHREKERLTGLLTKPDNDEQAVSDLAKLVYQGWHRCNEAASGRFSGSYSKVFIAKEGEFELSYQRNGSPRFSFVETSETLAVPQGDYEDPPAAQQEAEHDCQGFTGTVEPSAMCSIGGKPVPVQYVKKLPPRVRDDETND